MSIEVITKDDLQTIRMQLLNDIRQLLSPQEAKLIKPWSKNNEVKKLLSISSNTFQRLRIAGKLRSTKVGGVHYYRYDDIEKLLNNDAA
ncbi:MAG TPA: helix-turn-helix domain-containing protein [Chitinophagaceae bacterium]